MTRSLSTYDESADYAIGMVHLLAGRTDEAIDSLARTTAACNAMNNPLGHTRAHYWLGRAYEQKGEPDRACAAYQVVLDRWGQARPRSVTADDARSRACALGCPGAETQR